MKNGADFPRRFSCFCIVLYAKSYIAFLLCVSAGYEMENCVALLHNKKSGMDSMPLFAR